MSTFKNYSNAFMYFAGTLVQGVVSIIMQPLYSSCLTATEFGILGYFEAIRNFLLPLFIFGMTSVYLMKFFTLNENENKQRLFNILFHLTILNLLISVLVSFVIYYFFEQAGSSIPFTPYLYIVLLNLILDNFKSFLLINYRIRKKAIAFFIVSVIHVFLNALLGWLFVLKMDFGAVGRISAPLVGGLLILPIIIIELRKFSERRINFHGFIKNAKIAFPLVIAGYAIVPVLTMDRFFLERLNNTDELGIYSLGLLISGYGLIGIRALVSAFEPDIFKHVIEGKNKAIIKDFIMILTPFIIGCFIYFFLSSHIISILTAGKFMKAELYCNILVIATFFFGVFIVCDKVFIALEKNRLKLYAATIGSITGLIIMYFAVAQFEFLGAAYARLLINFILAIASLLLVYFNLIRRKLI